MWAENKTVTRQKSFTYAYILLWNAAVMRLSAILLLCDEQCSTKRRLERCEQCGDFLATLSVSLSKEYQR